MNEVLQYDYDDIDYNQFHKIDVSIKDDQGRDLIDIIRSGSINTIEKRVGSLILARTILEKGNKHKPEDWIKVLVVKDVPLDSYLRVSILPLMANVNNWESLHYLVSKIDSFITNSLVSPNRSISEQTLDFLAEPRTIETYGKLEHKVEDIKKMEAAAYTALDTVDCPPIKVEWEEGISVFFKQ